MSIQCVTGAEGIQSPMVADHAIPKQMRLGMQVSCSGFYGYNLVSSQQPLLCLTNNLLSFEITY